jgi:DNA phosphorothioation-associated putative methyltransferase
MKRAFQVVRRVTGAEQWDAISAERRNDLLVYLALGRFPKRPILSSLPSALQRDVKALFGTYKAACLAGDDLLYAAGDMSKVDAACKAAPFGKLMPTALYVHVDSLNRLPGLLRVYEVWVVKKLSDFEMSELRRIKDWTVLPLDLAVKPCY